MSGNTKENKITYGVLKNGSIYTLHTCNWTQFKGQLIETLENIEDSSSYTIVESSDVVLITNDLKEALERRRVALTELYQCPGCAKGNDIECESYKVDLDNQSIGCINHYPKTLDGLSRTILPGLPKGFNIIGNHLNMEKFVLYINDNHSFKWQFDFLQVPVWKYLDKNGNTLLRFIQPRLNKSLMVVIQGDVRYLLDCLEITEEHLDKML